MPPLFATGFQTVFLSMLRIVLVALFAAFLTRRRIIQPKDIDTLSRITIHVLLPCLILTSLITRLNTTSSSLWWILPLASMAMNLGGLFLGWVLFGRTFHKHPELIAMCGIQNSAYLVLPVGQALFPASFDTFAAYCFLFVIGNTPIHWTLGVRLVGGKDKINLKGMLNPPLIASLLGVVLVLLGLTSYVPPLVMDSTRLLGSATIPLATFILGATLGEVRFKSLPPWHGLLRLSFVKFGFIPLATWACISAFHLADRNPLVASLFMIQAAAAPATNLILQARAYNGRTEILGGAMLICYAVCLFAIPFWLTLAAPV
ncbi:AEC family transporter [Desulfoluna sp.]|uniref:AEC family transporter n=1 Tax=Desulfoluna sp. TaxID=2045199 RepID=UPI00261D50F6|nr:AEC family transporter [Desulfoluna sp.]